VRSRGELGHLWPGIGDAGGCVGVKTLGLSFAPVADLDVFAGGVRARTSLSGAVRWPRRALAGEAVGTYPA